jgi:hypothetical protein
MMPLRLTTGIEEAARQAETFGFEWHHAVLAVIIILGMWAFNEWLTFWKMRRWK